jgi:hypothetical protein
MSKYFGKMWEISQMEYLLNYSTPFHKNERNIHKVYSL